jgi:Tir chaperone protein (CesT) family
MVENNPVTIVNEWLKHYGREVLDTDIKLDDKGECALEFRDNIIVTVGAAKDSGVLYLVSQIASLVEFPMEQAVQLQKSLFFAGEQVTTLQGTLCLSPDKRSILLSWSRNIEEIDEQGFNRAMLYFLDTCIGARQFLSENNAMVQDMEND